MSNRIQQRFETLRNEGRKALVAYLTAADPTPSGFLENAEAALSAGADILEIGMPFSDPLADGPTIQRAMTRAMQHISSFEDTLALATQIRQKHPETPLVVFGYLNPWLMKPLTERSAQCKQASVDGALVVDCPPEESAPVRGALSEQDLDWIRLVAPTSGERLDGLLDGASGFVYLISMTGVTGGQLTRFDGVESMVSQIKQKTDLPVCVGFGIRNASDAIEASRHADGVVVGSAIVEAAENDGAAGIHKLVSQLRAGLDANGA